MVKMKKKVGNACRTKNQIRNSKSRGSQLEYDCQESLETLYLDITRTAERGFQQQYDLRSDITKTVFECKRLKGMSWNQAEKFFKKLKEKAPSDYKCFLLFKSNQQPCLVMYEEDYMLNVMKFEDYFDVPFVKHKSTRNRE